MKKAILTFFATMILSFNATAFEKSIAFYVGHGNGGLSSAFQTIVSQELVKKGWEVDFKIIGNCGKVKHLLETGNKPTLAGWGADWNNVKSNVCYNPPKEQQFVSTFIISPRLLCGPYGDNNFALNKGKKYVIGVNQGQNHHILLGDLGKKLGVDFKVVEYRNSGFIKRAMQSKEINAWYATTGLVNHQNKKQKCLYGTLQNPYLGITPLKTLLPTENVFSSFVGYLIVNDKVQGELKTALLKDVREIIGSKEYQQKLVGAGSFVTSDSEKDQLSFINATSLAFKK